MLPLSVLPFYAYVTQTPEGHLLWTKATHPLVAPDLPLLSGGEARWIDDEAPRYADAAAVLVYHGLGTSVGEEASQTMTPAQFGEQLVALRTAGMNPVTATEFAEACAGGSPLPDNAVMITFDDGRTEAMMHADPLLEQADMTATMFVISGAADTPSLFYAGWSTLSDYHASGRWDLQAHSDALHDTIPPDPAGAVQQRPLLVNRLDGESLADWRARLTADLDASSDKLREHTGDRPVAFAYPFGAYGGDERSNDPRIERELREVVAAHVEIAFHQDEQDTVDLADCDDDPLMLRRLDVGPWSGSALVARVAEMARSQQRSGRGERADTEGGLVGELDVASPVPGADSSDGGQAAATEPSQGSPASAGPSNGPAPAGVPPPLPGPVPVPSGLVPRLGPVPPVSVPPPVSALPPAPAIPPVPVAVPPPSPVPVPAVTPVPAPPAEPAPAPSLPAPQQPDPETKTPPGLEKRTTPPGRRR